MRRHARTNAARLSAAVLLSLALLPALPGAALGGIDVFSASAGLAPVRQFVGDSVGSLYSLTVRNTSSSAGIGAVEINRPADFWTVLGCPDAPSGWSSVQSVDRCRYISALGSGDNIAPGAQARFTMLVSTADSVRDVGGTWSVLVSMTEEFTNAGDLASATPMAYGLKTRAFSFQIMDAVISDGPATVGAPCPSSNKTAEPGSTHTLVLCGRNRTTQTQTLQPRYAGLKGTFIHSHGSFTGGPVAPTANSVVLGNWADVVISNAVGADLTVLARVRSAPKRTSAWKTLDGYEASGPNSAPVADDDSFVADEDQTLNVVSPNILDGDTDADLDPLSVATVNGSALNVGVPISLPSAATLTVNSDGTFSYLADDNFNGPDSFTYTAFDGISQSNTATVSITVNPANDPPVADNDSYTVDQGFSLLVLAAGGVLVGDTDVDLDTLAVGTVNGSALSVGVAIVIPSGATLTVNADGSFLFSPSSGFSGGDSFTYTSSDGTAQSNSATVSITVNPSDPGGGGGGCLIIC